MKETVINKIFNTRKEMEEYESKLLKKYIVLMIVHKDQILGEPEIYGIEKVLHFGERS